jgi:hypothetical protein
MRRSHSHSTGRAWISENGTRTGSPLEDAVGAGSEVARLDRRVEEDRLEHGGHGAAIEGRLPGEPPVEDRPDAVDVTGGALLGDLARRLLGGHVAGRAEHLARPREPRAADLAGEAEVGEPRAPRALDEDVGRLHVAVDDPVRVGVVERERDLSGDPRELARRERPALQDGLEALAFDEVHDEERPPAVLASVADRDDPFVAQARDRADLALEALHVLVVVRARLEDDLDRDGRPERRVEAAEDDPHAAAAELAEGDVAADPASRVGEGLLHLGGQLGLSEGGHDLTRDSTKSTGTSRQVGGPVEARQPSARHMRASLP